jgi:hypothetical protein
MRQPAPTQADCGPAATIHTRLPVLLEIVSGPAAVALLFIETYPRRHAQRYVRACWVMRRISGWWPAAGASSRKRPPNGAAPSPAANTTGSGADSEIGQLCRYAIATAFAIRREAPGLPGSTTCLFPPGCGDHPHGRHAMVGLVARQPGLAAAALSAPASSADW